LNSKTSILRTCAAGALLCAFALSACLPAAAATTGVVRGTVTLNGKPEAGARVVLQGEGQYLHTTSDSSGHFVFPIVPFGTYALTASAPGVSAYSQSVSLVSDEVLTLNIPLGTLKTIAHLHVSAHGGVNGTPVSVNTIGKRQLQALPTNTSLNRLVETVPGIVRFSYNEPVAHGFHGVAYEIDGAPVPLPTSSNFAELIDPRNIDSLEIFTGAIPAEYGGDRTGAVVNIITNRASDLAVPYQGWLTIGGGNYGQENLSFDNAIKDGKTEIFLNANTEATSRGLDAPTYQPYHDHSSQTDEFVRTITNFNDRQSVAFDFSNQLSQFQIPTNINPFDTLDPQIATPSADDVQAEYDRYADLNFMSVSKDGSGIVQVIPWLRYSRIAYNGDLLQDVLGATNLGPDAHNPNVNDYLAGIGLQQDRRAGYVGLNVSDFRASNHHAWKIGIDSSREVFEASQTFACYDPACNTVFTAYPFPAPPNGYTPFFSTQDQAGTQIGIYAQDKWTPNSRVGVDYGLRYDHSTGYVGGDQISPRIGVNYALASGTIAHAYYGRFYAAPQLEDVRNDCVILSGCAGTPTYNLQPETDSYAEFGLAHTFPGNLSGYVNVWTRRVNNVLDTTQLLNTPLFVVYNNTIGRANGVEIRLQQRLPNQDSWFLSGTWSRSVAAGISGATFLFPPNPPGPLAAQLSPEDHDQPVAVNAAYTHRWGARKVWYATIEPEYGMGFPVAFEGVIVGAPSYLGWLPTHLTADFSIGRDAGRNGDRTPGFDLDVQNLFNDRYVIKIANGFNTTQIAQGRSFLLRFTEPL
jgi:outer membrane receptor protein involved in Fe transport